MDIQLDLALEGADAEELDEAARDLQRELSELVDVGREGDVCILTLRRPEKLNALSTAVERALGEALGSDSVRTSRWVPPELGRMPSETSGRPKAAVSSATRKSAASASSSPPPRQ